MVNFIVWLILGGIIGWLASIVMRTDAQQGVFLNIVVGVVGSFIGGIVLRSFGKINNNDFSLSALFAAFVGALILLGIVNLVRRGSVR